MDGNHRWAAARGRPGVEGHQAGAESVRTTIKGCVELGIQVLTLFAFSCENWQRPTEEVDALMQLFMDSLTDEVPELHAQQVQIRFIGDLTRFSPTLQQRIQAATELTQNNQRLVLVIAANYSGQWDLCQATRTLAQAVLDGHLSVSAINETTLGQQLCLQDLPPPDLCIRTSGEQRISNFLLWQIAYAELYFTETYWPDFDFQALKAAIASYHNRQRRFGAREDTQTYA